MGTGFCPVSVAATDPPAETTGAVKHRLPLRGHGFVRDGGSNRAGLAPLVGRGKVLRRGKDAAEYELLDTGVFDQDRYFDVFAEYAKASPEDVLIQITICNRAPEAAPLHVLPTLWFRNTWSWGRTGEGYAARSRERSRYRR